MTTMNATQFVARVTAAVAFVAVALPAGAQTSSPTYIAGAQTRAAFAKGQPLVETAIYKVHASRREAPGMAEIHTLDTDIIYVLDGAATIVTGGKTVDAREIAPYEIRGSRIEGGSVQRLSEGDLYIVPNGVPHWFTEVQGPFLYYVVKTTAPAPTGGVQ